MSEEMNFDLEPIEVPVTVRGVRYVLREASEAISIKLRGSQLKNARLRNGQLEASVENLAESQSLLVQACLFVVQDGVEPAKWQPISLAALRSFPTRIVQALFTRCQSISGLVEKEDAETLEKRIAADREKLAKLRNGHDEDEEGNPDGRPSEDISISLTG
jgi:hypothetical protein